MRDRIFALVLVLAVTAGGLSANGQDHAARVVRDIEYVVHGDHALNLDLYLPDQSDRPVPCVVFVHGGGWKNGSKDSAKKNAAWLTEHGFAVASIDYRLTDVARWPAQIDDCYAAVRWVRTHGNEHGIDSRRVGAWGTSAGGHLVALMGTRRCPKTEAVSSGVQAVCDWFGPSELLTMPPNNVGNGRTEEDVAGSNGAKLLGATVREVPELARDASALDHVSSDDAAFLIMHGDRDPGVPPQQSKKLHAELIKAGVPSRLVLVKGAGHGGKEFQAPASRAEVRQFFERSLKANWNQGAGAGADFRVRDVSGPTHWSVVRDQNIRWRLKLPETGQSTVVTWGDRVFFTTMKPVSTDARLGSDIVAWCCDAKSGQKLWKREIVADHPLRLSGCFSDSSAPPPVTDGKRVCFFNASGRIACFDFEGHPIWQRELMPVGRSQPTIVGDRVVFVKQTYMPDDQGHFSHDHKDAPLSQWTQLQALELATGKDAWTTTCGVNMGCVPILQTLIDGRRVMMVGRGGGHSPPETPDGVSMINAADGTTAWTLPLSKFMSTMVFPIAGDQSLVFDAGDHLWIDAESGSVDRRVSIVQDVSVRSRRDDGTWVDEEQSLDMGRKTRAIIQQSNVLAGSYHYFRSYTEAWLGRIDIRSGRVEYLQLPIQLRRTATDAKDELLWNERGMDPELIERFLSAKKKRPKFVPITQLCFAPNDMKNSRGHVVVGDDRSMGNGWGHYASAVPTVIGDHLYVPTMAGTVYVIKWNSDTLDESAIVAINDLGTVGRSWNRASLSFSDGRIYAHTIGELICIGD